MAVRTAPLIQSVAMVDRHLAFTSVSAGLSTVTLIFGAESKSSAVGVPNDGGGRCGMR